MARYRPSIRRQGIRPSAPGVAVPPPVPLGASDDEGIVISVGPRDGRNRFIKSWLTFPVTPEEIPVAAAAQWSDQVVIGLGEVPTFVGKSLDGISFSGMLEPPKYWGPVMQDGARRGFNQDEFFDSWTFKDMIEDAMKHGEIVRLVIGDMTGWNGLVSIRDFPWRWSDPDPDTLLFDITFKEHVERELLGTGKSPKNPIYVTRAGDTLGSIAIRELHSRAKWKQIHSLNKEKLAELWYYGPSGQEPESVGERLPGRQNGHRVGRGRAEGRFDIADFPHDLKFRAGIHLRIVPRPKKDKKKDARKVPRGRGKAAR